MPNLLFYILTSNNWPSNIDSIGQFFRIFFTFAFVLVLAYFMTKLISQSYLNRGKALNMRIIESIGVGRNSLVQLLKVGSKFYLIGITKEKITLLSEINEADIDMDSLSETTAVPFDKYLNAILKKGNKSDK